MFVCGCGRWMHTQGVDESWEGPRGTEADSTWLVRTTCLGCGLAIGCEASPDQAVALVDRLVWSDDAGHALDRMPPYVASLIRPELEEYVRSKGRTVVTVGLMAEARQGGAVAWDPEAERRLDNVPAPVRAMARLELERTAVEKGQARVTVSLMEQVKARYFGMGSAKREA